LTNKKIYLTGTTSDETSVRKNEYYDTGVYITAESGTLHAESFEGKVNADNITDGTLDPERLGLSGVTSGTYGTPSDQDIDLGTGGFFMVPNLTIDSHGRVTSASEAQVYFPAAPNDKVKTELWENDGIIKLVGTIDGGTGSLLYYPGIYIESQYGQLCSRKIYTKNIEFEIDYGDNDYAYIDGIDYSGTAAKSKTTNSITTHIVDSTDEDTKGETSKALSANQGYLLDKRITNVSEWIQNNSSCISTYGTKIKTLEESVTDLESEYGDLQNDFDEFKESFQNGCFDGIASALAALVDYTGSSDSNYFLTDNTKEYYWKKVASATLLPNWSNLLKFMAMNRSEFAGTDPSVSGIQPVYFCRPGELLKIKAYFSFSNTSDTIEITTRNDDTYYLDGEYISLLSNYGFSNDDIVYNVSHSTSSGNYCWYMDMTISIYDNETTDDSGSLISKGHSTEGISIFQISFKHRSSSSVIFIRGNFLFAVVSSSY
jgi:hypothetical protein